MRRKLLVALMLTLAIGSLVPACAAREAEEDVFRIGILGPFTGHSARVGEEMWGAAEMAFDAIDYQIGHYTIELIRIDSESDPEKAARAYEEAIARHHIDVGLLSWHSSVSVGVMDVAAHHRIPHFIPGGATEVINEKYHSDPDLYSWWLGKNWPVPEKLSIGYVEAVEAAMEAGVWQPGQKNAVIYGEDTDWGRSFGAGIKAQLEAAGWHIVSEDYFAADEVEFYPLLSKWGDREAVLLAGTLSSPTSFASLVKQAQEIGLEALFIADGLGWTGEWYELAGHASDYVLDQIPQWTTEASKAFRDEFEQRYGFVPSPSGAAVCAYDPANFFIQTAQAIYEEHGELTGDLVHETVWEQIRAGEFVYEDGIIMTRYQYTLDSFPDPVVGREDYIFPVIQYFNGEGRIIWPGDWSEDVLAVPEW